MNGVDCVTLAWRMRFCRAVKLYSYRPRGWNLGLDGSPSMLLLPVCITAWCSTQTGQPIGGFRLAGLRRRSRAGTPHSTEPRPQQGSLVEFQKIAAYSRKRGLKTDCSPVRCQTLSTWPICQGSRLDCIVYSYIAAGRYYSRRLCLEERCHLQAVCCIVDTAQSRG